MSASCQKDSCFGCIEPGRPFRGTAPTTSTIATTTLG